MYYNGLLLLLDSGYMQNWCTVKYIIIISDYYSLLNLIYRSTMVYNMSNDVK